MYEWNRRVHVTNLSVYLHIAQSYISQSMYSFNIASKNVYGIALFIFRLSKFPKNYKYGHRFHEIFVEFLTDVYCACSRYRTCKYYLLGVFFYVFAWDVYFKPWIERWIYLCVSFFASAIFFYKADGRLGSIHLSVGNVNE